MDDISPEMAQKVCEMIQEKTPYERVVMGCSMNETSRYLVTQGILHDNPNISTSELRQELFLKFYNNDFSNSEIDKIQKHLRSLP